ncbi:STAS domain-containing protein [Halodesulfovibrio marinisediminis]|uniref:Anti-sigma factor antagonist n=1 Tax=Halodesulfovibrio marinisediminis DSM 17456 TaxID=1121457 RepID=A0A1N6I9M1_9BACT|nr:STAS domain-containing protein [Halodesulfovibrio marinisediminis]SIO28716.1 anti-anti-sigma factor [Halodesulfovibrio marinisediminis DSM 17456]
MNEENRIKITEEVVGTSLLMHLSGHLDVVSGSILEKNLAHHILSDRIAVVIDMEGVEYLSSAGLRTLLLMVKQSRRYGTQLFFCNLSSFVKDIFEVSGFNALLTIFETQEGALKQAESLR